MTGSLGRLWRGDLPLRQAFWDYAILYGVPFNLLATFVYLILLTRDAWPIPALVINFLPVVYNALVAVGVWRSAGRHGPPWGDYARGAIVLWFAVFVLA